MQIRTILEIIAAVLIAAIGFSYIQAREATAKMQAVLDAQNITIQQAQEERTQHAKDDAVRDAATQQMIQSWQQTVAQLKTPQQQVQWSQQQLVDAIKGIQISVNPQTGQAMAMIPAASIPELPAVIEKCKECDAKLSTAQADLQSRSEQMQLADLQIKALQTERDAAVQAVKGGSWIKRLGRQVKVIGCATGGAAIGATRGGKEAAIGALGGGVLCSIF